MLGQLSHCFNETGSGKGVLVQMNQKKNNMAVVSLIFGILSIVTACCGIVGFPLGALAILFARLSKVDFTMEGKARAGLICGIVGMLLSVIALIIWIYDIFNSSGTSIYDEIYGLAPKIQGLLMGGVL